MRWVERLPTKIRSDIEEELKSTLMDMLEDRSGKANRESDEEMARDLLKGFGSPELVAATYQPAKYLIGPRIYPTFMTILKIVLVVLGIASVVRLGIRLGQIGMVIPESARLVGTTFLSLFQSAIQAFGTLVIVFVVVEQFTPANPQIMREWKPEDLLKVEEPDKISMTDVILSIVFATIAIVVFNLYPELISFYQNQNGNWVSFPILSNAFFRLLLWLNIIWILEIILYGLVLRDNVWTKKTRLFEIGVKIINIVVIVAMAAGPSIVQLPMEWMQSVANLSSESALLVQTQFAAGFRVVLGLVAAIIFLDTLRKTYKFFKK